MLEFINVFFGFAEDNRPVEGWLSWQHLLFVTTVVIISVFLAFFWGKKAKARGNSYSSVLMKKTAVLMLSCECAKIIMTCWSNHDPLRIFSNLPLFLCSIMLFAIPIAAFGKGRLKQAAIDFSFIFGPLCMIAGTYLSANYFNGSPILRFGTLISVTTHCISGFFGFFVLFSGKVDIHNERVRDYSLILLCFEALALGANKLNDKLNILWDKNYETNYMFLSEDSGTPFSIVTSIANGNQFIYTLIVAAVYFVYLFLFVFFCLKFKKR